MNATQYSAMCAQKPRTRLTDPVNIYRIHISEDCLYLNVFAPPQVIASYLVKYQLTNECVNYNRSDHSHN